MKIKNLSSHSIFGKKENKKNFFDKKNKNIPEVETENIFNKNDFLKNDETKKNENLEVFNQNENLENNNGNYEVFSKNENFNILIPENYEKVENENINKSIENKEITINSENKNEEEYKKFEKSLERKKITNFYNGEKIELEQKNNIKKLSKLEKTKFDENRIKKNSELLKKIKKNKNQIKNEEKIKNSEIEINQTKISKNNFLYSNQKKKNPKKKKIKSFRENNYINTLKLQPKQLLKKLKETKFESQNFSRYKKKNLKNPTNSKKYQIEKIPEKFDQIELKKFFSKNKIHSFNHETENKKDFVRIFGNDFKLEKIVLDLKKDGIFLKEKKESFKKKSDFLKKDYKVKLWDKAIYPEKRRKSVKKVQSKNNI